MLKNKVYLYVNSKFEIKPFGRDKRGIIGTYKNKQITIIFEAREILIKTLLLPLCNRNKTYNMVYNELIYELGNVDDILFDYRICNINDKKMNVLVYCIKWSKDNLLKSIINYNSIEKIYILPLFVIRYIKIKVKNYILFYNENYMTYMMEFENGILISFHTYSVDKIHSIEEYINFINSNKNKENNNIKEIYFANFISKEIIVQLMKNYRCYDMGLITINDILNSETNNRRFKWKI